MLTVPWSWEINLRSVLIVIRTNRSINCLSPRRLFIPGRKRKDFEVARRNFLWFGSHGFVHKGLDLVLDAFAEMPEYHLTVCGPIDEDVEKDFKKAFHKELYQTSDTHCIGMGRRWQPSVCPDCRSVCRTGLPSCSEGQSGGVITCMHAGLIPILSYESGVDVEGFGFLLQDCSVDRTSRAL